MFDFKSFLEGFVAGLLFISVFWAGIYFKLKDIAKAIRNPKDTVAKDMFGQIKKAQIVYKKNKIDELLGE